MTEKVAGLKEEVVGKVKKDPAKVQHGKEKRTGELKRKQLEEGDVRPTIHSSSNAPWLLMPSDLYRTPIPSKRLRSLLLAQ